MSLPVERQVVLPFTPTRERAVPECLFEIEPSRWLLAYNEHRGVEDESVADICCMESSDDGATWSPPRVLVPRGEHVNVVAPCLLRLRDGRIALSYAGFDSYHSQHMYYQTADTIDGPWSKPARITQVPGCHSNAGQRLLELQSGRLLQPVCSAPFETDDRIAVYCAYTWFSDDGGRTWACNPKPVELPKRGCMEPVAVELSDGRLRMFIRNQFGHIHQCLSSDEGQAWTVPTATTLVCPESCCFLTRIGATGDLAAVWNCSHYDPDADHCGPRCPLSVAVSSDEGETWSDPVHIETDTTYTYSMPVAAFNQQWALFAYYKGHGTQSSGHVEGALSRCAIDDLYRAIKRPR
jgi:hypothetical protein